MTSDLVRTSKFLSLILRHKPQEIGLMLDENGWADVDELIRLANRHGTRLSRALVDRVVADNDKQRFALSDDGQRIRANQGHSVAIDLALPPTQPPELLYHGTAAHSVDSIRSGGLRSAGRRHVHLSPDAATATRVGQRHGRPVVLVIRARDMVAEGHEFFRSDNGVWLTERVPAKFIRFPVRESSQRRSR